MPAPLGWGASWSFLGPPPQGQPPRATAQSHPGGPSAENCNQPSLLHHTRQCPELPQGCVAGMSGYVGGVVTCPALTLTPQLSGSPPRRLYFLGAVHKYEGPNHHHFPRGRKGRCGPGSANRELWAPGEALAASLVSRSPDMWAPTGTGCNAAPHNQSPLSPSKRSSQPFRRFTSDSMPELVSAAKAVRRPR